MKYGLIIIKKQHRSTLSSIKYLIFARKLVKMKITNKRFLATLLACAAFIPAAWADDEEENDSTLTESILNMPNAFSPNGDGMNDIYKAKSDYRNITEFHAYIFNRWGQKLYDWTDIAGGWDGTYKGNPVKEGVYFVLVKAKGGDGKVYSIKRDVNLLRGYTEGTTTEE